MKWVLKPCFDRDEHQYPDFTVYVPYRNPEFPSSSPCMMNGEKASDWKGKHFQYGILFQDKSPQEALGLYYT